MTYEIQQLSLCGIRIDMMDYDSLIRLLGDAKQTRKKILVLNHNLHSLYIHKKNHVFREIYEQASWIYVDGIPVIWLGRMAGLPLTRAHRITFLDRFESILEEAAHRGWRVFYLGSKEEVLDKGLAVLREKHPGLVIEGHHGMFEKTGPETEAVIAQINEFQTDILFVGMGMPLQETWLADHQSKLSVCAMLTSGATMDYVAGSAYRPPAWAGKWGLYGVMRLLSDPKRLYSRYLIEPLFLITHLSLRLIWQRLKGPSSTPAVAHRSHP